MKLYSKFHLLKIRATQNKYPPNDTRYTQFLLYSNVDFSIKNMTM